MMDENPEFPVYENIEAVFRERKTSEENIQLIASCILNGKADRSVWIEVPAGLYNSHRGKVKIVEYNMKNGLLQVTRVQKA